MHEIQPTDTLIGHSMIGIAENPSGLSAWLEIM